MTTRTTIDCFSCFLLEYLLFLRVVAEDHVDDGIDVGDVDLAVAVDALAIFKPTVTCHDGIVVSSFFVVLMLYFRLDDFDMILTT